MNGNSLLEKSPRPSLRQKQKEGHRRQILDAAEAVFGAQGYHDASITQIAHRAELAVGTIYLYFADKADLYGSLTLEKMNQVVSRLEAALDSSLETGTGLRAAAHALFDFHDANRRFFEIFLHQHQIESSPLNKQHWREMEDLKRRNLESIEHCIRSGQKRGEFKPGSPRLYAVAFLGMTLQMIRQWIREESHCRLADSADFAADCFLHGATVPTRSTKRRSS